MNKKTANCKNYFFYDHEKDGMVLCGESYGHPTVKDGNHLVSSSILSPSFESTEIITVYTMYSVSEPLAELGDYWVNKFRQLGFDEKRAIFVDK